MNLVPVRTGAPCRITPTLPTSAFNSTHPSCAADTSVVDKSSSSTECVHKTHTRAHSRSCSLSLSPGLSLSIHFYCLCFLSVCVGARANLSLPLLFCQSEKSLVMCCLSRVPVPLSEISSQPSLSARQPYDPQGG